MMRWMVLVGLLLLGPPRGACEGTEEPTSCYVCEDITVAAAPVQGSTLAPGEVRDLAKVYVLQQQEDAGLYSKPRFSQPCGGAQPTQCAISQVCQSIKSHYQIGTELTDGTMTIDVEYRYNYCVYEPFEATDDTSGCGAEKNAENEMCRCQFGTTQCEEKSFSKFLAENAVGLTSDGCENLCCASYEEEGCNLGYLTLVDPPVEVTLFPTPSANTEVERQINQYLFAVPGFSNARVRSTSRTDGITKAILDVYMLSGEGDPEEVRTLLKDFKYSSAPGKAVAAWLMIICLMFNQ